MKAGTISDSDWNSEAIALAPESSSFYGSGFGGYGAYGGDGYPQDTSGSDSDGAAPGAAMASLD